MATSQSQVTAGPWPSAKNGPIIDQSALCQVAWNVPTAVLCVALMLSVSIVVKWINPLRSAYKISAETDLRIQQYHDQLLALVGSAIKFGTVVRGLGRYLCSPLFDVPKLM